MHRHRRTGILWFLPLVLLACSPGAPQEPRLTRIEINPPGLLLASIGDSRTLQAIAYDQYGDVMDVELDWSSSNQEQVTVENGTVSAATAIGSSQIVASAGSVHSTPVVVVVAELVPEAVLVSDAQIVGEIEAVDDTQAFGPGYRYTVRLQDVLPPEVGSVLVASEGAPVVGRVVAVAGDEVTLEVIPLDEVVTGLELDDQLLDLTRAPLQFPPEVEEAFDIQTAADGTTTLSLKPGVTLSSRARSVGGLAEIAPQATQAFDLGPFSCEAEGVLSIDVIKAKFTFSSNLSLDAAWNDSLRKLVVGGQPTVSYDLRPVLSAALTGKVDCRATLAEFKIPLPGFLGFFLGGIVPLGVGFELGGALPLPAVGVDVQGSISATVAAGFVCPAGGECSFPRSFEMGGTPPKVTPVIPDAPPGVKLDLEANAYAFAGLEAGITSQKLIKALGTVITSVKNYRIQLLVAKGGLKLSAKLASEVTQAQDDTYAAEYGINFEATIAAGKSVQAFFDLVKLNAFSLSFELANVPLASSPKLLSMSLDHDSFEAGDEVAFTVNLDPQFLTFLGSHNVDAVRIYRESGGTLVLVNETNAAPGQQSVVVPWVASLDSEEGMRFVAFVQTSFFPALRLELGAVTIGAAPVASGEIRVSWREVRDYDETIKPHETAGLVVSGGFLRSELVQELSAVMQVEMEQVGDDLIFTVFDQSTSGSETLDHDYEETYTVKVDDCTSTARDTVDMHLSGSSSALSSLHYRDFEGLEIRLGVDLVGTRTVIWNYPCAEGDNSGNETEDQTKALFRWLVLPVLIDPDAPGTLVGTYTDTIVTPTITETEASRIESTVTETIELRWNLQAP